jgi:hypothetical protein
MTHGRVMTESGCRTARPFAGQPRLLGRLHDLRHTHATLVLADGVPVKVVSERLGHASATITLTVHQQLRPGMGRQAADRFAALLEGLSEAEVSRRCHEPRTPRQQNTPGS